MTASTFVMHSTMHAYVHALGYHLERGTTILVERYVVECIVPRLASSTQPADETGTLQVDVDCGTAPIEVSRSWLEARLACTDSRVIDRAARTISAAIRSTLFAACTLSRAHGRKRVKAADVALLTQFGAHVCSLLPSVSGVSSVGASSDSSSHASADESIRKEEGRM